jgi:hypothetical protein
MAIHHTATRRPTGSRRTASRLKIGPRDAQVFVDGYYVGIVDESTEFSSACTCRRERIALKCARQHETSFRVIRFDETTNLRGRPAADPVLLMVG